MDCENDSNTLRTDAYFRFEKKIRIRVDGGLSQIDILIELSYICTQFMKYQNLRGGRVKLHHIMVRYLLFFSAKKETTTTKLSKTSPLKKSSRYLPSAVLLRLC